MADTGSGDAPKPATAARIYDYHLGGTHNFPADRAAAKLITQTYPRVPAIARTGRAFLGRAVRYLAAGGVRQFLDIGSGIPTEGNVHEIAQEAAPGSRVVYVDIDPVAVAESLELLEGNPDATALRGDVRDGGRILAHPQVREMVDFSEPVGLLLLAVLHFVPDDDEAYGAVRELVAGLAPGSHLVISHAAAEATAADPDRATTVTDVYKRQTVSQLKLRTRDQVERFFDGLDVVEPGVVWVPQWRPEPTDPQDFTASPLLSAGIVGVGRVR